MDDSSYYMTVGRTELLSHEPGADPRILEEVGSGSSKRQARRNLQTDKQNKNLRGGGLNP